MRNELNNMKIGFTKNINGLAVTRWSETKWEVGTFGRKMSNLQETLEQLN